MHDAQYGSQSARVRDEADVAELDGLGMAAVVLYGRDGGEPAARVPEEPRSFATRSSWLWRWAGWRRPA